MRNRDIWSAAACRVWEGGGSAPPHSLSRGDPRSVRLCVRLTMGARPTPLPFDLTAAMQCLGERDECLKRLIAETAPFQLELKTARSPYEALLESIAYQSISGKAAATIFARVKA